MNIDTGKLLYIASVDITLPEGPSVNEREFAWALHKAFGDRVQMLLMKPAYRIDEISEYRAEFISRSTGTNPITLIAHQIDLYKKASKYVATGKYDLIVIRLGLLPFGLYCLMKTHKMPYAIKTLTGYPRSFAEVQKGSKRIIGQVIAPCEEFLLREIAKNAMMVDACTLGHIRGIKHNLKIDDTRLIHIENATNTERFKPRDKVIARKKCGLNGFNPIIGYVGGRPWERGCTELILIGNKLIKKYNNIGFVIVGGGQGMGCLSKLAREHKVEDHFFFTGVVPYNEVPLYINAFDVGIAFDKDDRILTVGNSNQKVRQYIASGVPAVTTPVGCEFIPQNNLGSTVNVKKLESLVYEIDKWLSLTTSERRKHEKRAAAYARENLSTDKMLSKRIDFWNNQLNNIMDNSGKY